MPVADITAARDAIMGVFKTAMEASAYPQSVVPVAWPDVKFEPPVEGPWMRFNMVHTNERQKTLNPVGSRRFRIYGIITVQVFVPYGFGRDLGYLIATVVKTAFRGASAGSDAIDFHTTRIIEAGQDGPWSQTNVMSDFVYDEIA